MAKLLLNGKEIPNLRVYSYEFKTTIQNFQNTVILKCGCTAISTRNKLFDCYENKKFLDIEIEAIPNRIFKLKDCLLMGYTQIDSSMELHLETRNSMREKKKLPFIFR